MYLKSLQRNTGNKPAGLKSSLLFPLVLTLVLLPGICPGEPLVAENTLGTKKALVLMLKFKDVRPKFNVRQMKPRYFNKLNRYVEHVSYGKTRIRGDIKGWYTLPEPVKAYRISRRNLEVDKGRIRKLVQHGIDMADEDVDFSAYDFVLLSLGAQRKDYGMMGYCAYPGLMGWKKGNPFETKSGGKIPGGVAVYCENAHVGVIFHDVAHILGGVRSGRRIMPCLYDHDLQAQKGTFRGYYQFYIVNMGYWDPMSCHFYDRKLGPPGICSWTRMRLNWLDEQSLCLVEKGKDATCTLGPLAKPDAGAAAIKIPLDRDRYYLVENRQPIGSDRNLPGSGVLVLYCDDTVPECRKGKAPVKLKVAKPDVEELNGAAFDIGPGQRDTYRDDENGFTIKLVEKTGPNYKVAVRWEN